MQYRRRLRSRIILSFLVFGTLLSGLFAASALFLQRQLEDTLIARTLEENLGEYVEQVRRDPTVVEPFSDRIDGYVTRPHQAAIVPEPFRDLPAGVHDVRVGNAVYKAAVVKDQDLWAFLTYDVSENRELTRRLVLALIVAVLLFSLLSFAIGAWSSKRVMAPVSDLARRLEEMKAQSRPTPLARHFPDDEVGQLAQALDDYAGRLQQLVERDKAFNADVSHELRTPLAVISGATELLLAQPDLPEKVHERLLRIARAARQSTDITAALLHLVRAERGTADGSQAQDVGEVVCQVVDNYRPLVDGHDLVLALDRRKKMTVIAPEAVLAVAVGNLLGNAVRYTRQGRVDVVVETGRVMILDTGPGIAESELPRVTERHYRGSDAGGKGSGLGLSIVQRLCDLYGWRIEFANRPEGGLKVTLWFFADREA